MKVLPYLLATWITATRIPDDADFKRQQILDNFMSPTEKPLEAPQPLNSSGRILSPFQGIEFHLKSAVDPQTRASLEASLKIAGGILENQIAFKKKIKVLVEYKRLYDGKRSTCKEMEGPEANCKPMYHSVIHGKQYLMYPQALAKQLDIPGLFHHEHDMEMNINSHVKFVFPHEYGLYKRGMVNDIVETILHEMGHGLGFFSELTNFESNILTIYDTHLFSQLDNSNVISLGDAKDFSKINRLASQEDSLYFKTNLGSHIKLATGTGILQSNRINHLDRKEYLRTTNYLMSEGGAFYANYLFTNKNQSTWNTSPLGPIYLEVLNTLGYPLNPSPDQEYSLIHLYKKLAPINNPTGEIESIASPRD